MTQSDTDYIRLSIPQAIEMLGMSKSTVYKWISENKFKFLESPRGKIILITQDEIDSIRELNKLYSPSNNIGQSQESVGQSKTVRENPKESIPDTMLEMAKMIAEYAEKAGATKYIEDSERKTQEECFRYKSESETLRLRNNELEKQIESLTKLNADLTNANAELVRKVDELEKPEAKKFLGIFPIK